MPKYDAFPFFLALLQSKEHITHICIRTQLAKQAKKIGQHNAEVKNRAVAASQELYPFSFFD